MFFLALKVSSAALGEKNAIDVFEGMSFFQAGPNCFGTALRLADLYPTFRGVDGPEMTAFLDLSCHQVESPVYGDLGVYFAPNESPIHAYFYIDDKVAMDKPGVDYNGRTMISMRKVVHIDYTYLIPKECLRYSRDNLSLCSNKKRFYRCDPKTLSKSVVFERMNLFELRLGDLLNKSVSKDLQHSLFKELKSLKNLFLLEASGDRISFGEKKLIHEQLESFNKQIQFFRE